MSQPGSNTLTLQTADGESESIALPGPGGTIRVVVGEPGRQSGVWRIWAPKNKFDVYIGVRALVGYEKWSLHESGDWRHQWISDEIAQEFGNSDDRIIDRWPQPAELGDSGWLHGFSIRVRHQDLVEVAEPEQVPADAVWIPIPPEGHAASLHVVIIRPDRGLMELNGLIPLGGFTLVDGRALILAVSVDRLADAQNEMIASALAEMMLQAEAKGIDFGSAVAPRGALACNNDRGDRFVWDVAVPRPTDVAEQAGA